MNTDEGIPSLPNAAGVASVTDPYVRYLVRNRDFTAPAVAAAIATLDQTRSGRHTRVLDAGTGGGGALRGLARLVRAAGGDGTVTAVDADARAIAAARLLVDDLRLERLVGLRVADIRDVAAEASAAGGAFDLVWSSDVLWPTTFADPTEVVRTLTDALVPGGTLALFTTNYYQSMFLPGHSRLERLVRTASELTWALPADGPTHHERLGAWMRDAGLTDITLRVFPLVASPATADPTAWAYLEQIVWPEMRRAAASNGRAAGMTDSDLVRAEELLDPTSPAWIGADPTTYVVQPTLLWTGRAPAA
ncbi:methyltransferase domain-containing protein [Nocardiopsis synnemataformans]|uniref:methyltransferase domain-containing protein n=1 Tax=Nocardiopsis synnemataformans TaxID=61305 RepID=UPI003EB83913